ncbi:MAG: hypothetical protein QOH39_1994 [Verrucomicrobiota bacterium]
MSARAFNTPDNYASTLRQLKVLAVALIVSNIALGVFGVYVLRKLDRNYSALITQTVPSLNELQTLTAVSMEAMRTTNPTLFRASPRDRAEPLTRAHLALERDRDLRQHALQREWLVLNVDERRNFEESGDAFTQKASDVIKLLESGDNAGANRLREESLRPAFNRYVTATTKTADVLEAQSLRTSGQLTAQAGSMSHMLLGLAGWPVIIAMLFLMIAILFIMGVLLKVFFSGREAA